MRVYLLVEGDSDLALLKRLLPPEIQPLYSGGYGLYAYAVLDASGRVLFSSKSVMDLSIVHDKLAEPCAFELKSIGSIGKA